jgi:hypothetical protein
MKRLALLALLFAGCATYCKSRCGMALTRPGECAPFQAQEQAALAIYDQRKIFPYRTACAALDGYKVEIRTDVEDAGVNEPTFDDEMDRDVAGVTSCWAKRIQVTPTPWHSQRNALSHEMVHAIQGCPTGPHGESHYGWYDAGIVDAIDAARPAP